MKKINAVIIVTLFIITNFTALPILLALCKATSLEYIEELNDENFSNTFTTIGEPPSPPLIWTVDFLTFYISLPQNPDNDQIYYFIEWGDSTSTGWLGPYEPGATISSSHVWASEGYYTIKVMAKDQDGESKKVEYTLAFFSDLKLFSVTTGYENVTYIFTFYLMQFEYYIYAEWGDGNNSGWLGLFNETAIFSHLWSLPGKYSFRFKIKDINGTESTWYPLLINIMPLKDNAPTAPIIRGLSGVKPGTYQYIFNSTDPNGDNVSYFVDWGDGTNTSWTSTYKSGEEVKINHTFFQIGIYLVKAKAKDPENYESEYGYLLVAIPKNTHQYALPLFLKLLMRLFNIK